MSEVVPLKLHSLRSHVYENRYDLFKSILRQHMPETAVAVVIAAIHDRECYARTTPDIKKIVDLYYHM
jgi:hypothetical protein